MNIIEQKYWRINNNDRTSEKLTFLEIRDRLNRNPWSIMDYDIRYIIERLKSDCILGAETRSKEARETLKLLGLKAFIPAGSIRRKTKSLELRKWQRSPILLAQIMNHLENRIRPHWDRSRPRNKRSKINRKILKLVVGEELTEAQYQNITYGERDKDMTHFALSIIAEFKNVPFESLKKVYYRDVACLRRQNKSYNKGNKLFLSQLEFEGSETHDARELQEIFNNKGIGYGRYMYENAYNFFIMRQTYL